MRVWAIALAAGEGRRMGGGKLTLPFGHSTVIRSVAAVLASAPVAGITVVLGHHADDVRAALDGIPCSFATNPRPDEGMLSSVTTGIDALPENVDAFLVVLGDQPELSAGTIWALIDAAKSSDRWMLIPEFKGKRGHPVLFRAEAIPSIRTLPPGKGLNTWREENPGRVQMVPVQAEEILRDIDTPEDYREALRRVQPPGGPA